MPVIRFTLEIIRNQDMGHATKALIHMCMCGDPCALLLVDKGLYVWILAIRHNSNEKVGRDDLTGIRIRDLSRITSPVNFDLFTRLPVDMHGCTPFLFVLLDMITELGVHERLIA